MSAQRALEMIESEKKNLIPTPRLGEIVLWFARGYIAPGRTNGQPAVVMQIEDAGRIQLQLIGPNKGGRKTGVKFHSMQGATDSTVEVTYRQGCWDYRDGDMPTKETHRDFQRHLESIRQREQQIIEHERRHKEAQKAKRQAAGELPLEDNDEAAPAKGPQKRATASK